MRTDIRLLTRREGKKSHHETLLIIDWSGVTEDQLRTLAQWAIMHEVQSRYFKAETDPPESQVVKAAEIVKDQPTLNLKYTPPPPKIKLSKEYQALLDNLSSRERDELMEMLK